MHSGVDAIVLGSFPALFRFPWFDGWHLFGELDVKQQLAGKPLAFRRLWISVVCHGCNWWAVARSNPIVYQPNLWLLNQLPNGSWTLVSDVGDIGVRPVEDWPEVRAHLKRYPQPRLPLVEP
jgi:hypothetical protein